MIDQIRAELARIEANHKETTLEIIAADGRLTALREDLARNAIRIQTLRDLLKALGAPQTEEN